MKSSIKRLNSKFIEKRNGREYRCLACGFQVLDRENTEKEHFAICPIYGKESEKSSE